MAGAVSEVSDNNFQAEVIENDQPVLVDFWAPWCGPCRVVAPHLEELAGERDDLRVVKLNVDDNPQTAASYNVMSIPTILLFKNGEVAHQIVGALPKNLWCRRSSRLWPRPPPTHRSSSRPPRAPGAASFAFRGRTATASRPKHPLGVFRNALPSHGKRCHPMTEIF